MDANLMEIQDEYIGTTNQNLNVSVLFNFERLSRVDTFSIEKLI